MSMTVVKGLQSEIFVPITPKSVWAPVTKPLSEMTVALATAAGVHRKDQERFNLAGDFTWRKIPNESEEDDLMVTHGGYDNSTVVTTTLTLTRTSTACSLSQDLRNSQLRDSSRLAHLTMQDSWAAAETLRSSPTRQVRL